MVGPFAMRLVEREPVFPLTLLLEFGAHEIGSQKLGINDK